MDMPSSCLGLYCVNLLTSALRMVLSSWLVVPIKSSYKQRQKLLPTASHC